MGIYTIKPWFRGRLAGLTEALTRRGVSADQVTTAGVLAAVLGGAAIGMGDRWHPLWLAVPVLVLARIAANALDGLVAVASATARPAGELYNETADRIGDAAFLGAVALVSGVPPALAIGALAAAELASFIGITARAAGGTRRYDGPMGKPDRMAVVALAGLVAAFLGRSSAGLVWNVALVVIAAGAVITAVNRYRRAHRELDRPSEGAVPGGTEAPGGSDAA
jgi:CDP-diacylglycerol--glycerol-3-phosphate 3-phosphatidyltransferase